MSTVNKVILIGNLGADPEVKFSNSGSAIANLTLATSEKWKDKTKGEQVEKTEWHRVFLFGKTAEVAGEYLRKGSKVYIEGKIQTRQWEQDGAKRHITEIVGHNMQMLDSKGEKLKSSSDQSGINTSQQNYNNEFEDDIPF